MDLPLLSDKAQMLSLLGPGIVFLILVIWKLRKGKKDE